MARIALGALLEGGHVLADEGAVVALAQRQRGCISISQATTLGWTPRMLGARVERGLLRRVLPGVVAFQWAPPSVRQRIWAVWLWAGTGSVFSHRTAALLWQFTGALGDAVDVVVPNARTRSPWIQLHRPSRLPRAHVRTSVEGFRLTSPPRTIVDLATTDIDDEGLERIIEQGLRRGLARMDELNEMLAALPGTGRGSVSRLARILRRGTLRPEVDSPLERKALRLFLTVGLPPPRAQFHVVEDGNLLGRVDFAWPHVKLIVEAESFQFHAGRKGWDKDIRRYNMMSRYGWTVLRLTDTDLRQGAPVLLQTLAEAMSRRLRAPAPRGRRALEPTHTPPVPLDTTLPLPGFE